jgi:hypothetical protein
MTMNCKMRTLAYSLYLFVRALAYARNKPTAVGNLRQPVPPYHPSTESSSMGSQLYVRKSPTSSVDKNKSQIGQLRGVPLIRSPHHTPVPPSPLHQFLAALGCRFLLKTCWWKIITAGFGRNEPNEVGVCLSLRDIPFSIMTTG